VYLNGPHRGQTPLRVESQKLSGKRNCRPRDSVWTFKPGLNHLIHRHGSLCAGTIGQIGALERVVTTFDAARVAPM